MNNKATLLMLLFLFFIPLAFIHANNIEYESVDCGLYYLINTNRNNFHRYWNQNWSVEGFITIPLYKGELQTGILFNSYHSLHPQFVNFNTIYLYFGWGFKYRLTSRIYCTPSVHLGNIFMLFERPENRPEIPSYIYDMEEELGMRLNLVFSYVFIRNCTYRIGFNYKVIYINKKIELNFLTTGFSYRFDMPKWLREFLK